MGVSGRGRWPLVRRASLTDARRTAPAGSSTRPRSEALQRVGPERMGFCDGQAGALAVGVSGSREVSAGANGPACRIIIQQNEEV